MGARTSVHVADDEAVRGVVALAPWLPPGEPVAALAGKRLVAAHGNRDRITSPRATRAYVERAIAVGAEATYVDMGRVGHYLLRRVPDWNRTALESSLSLLAD
jgi:predicted esterase